MRIALLTDHRWERPTAIDAGCANILREDALLAEALRARGVASDRVDWARPGVDWSAYDALLFRTTWDYYRRLPEFLPWLDHVGARRWSSTRSPRSAGTSTSATCST